jgi:hypothetical protein
MGSSLKPGGRGEGGCTRTAHFRRRTCSLDAQWRGSTPTGGRSVGLAALFGPEARRTSPVRILRDEATRETPGIEGIYPVGEGAGYAGGIISAAVEGLRSARAIVARYAPLQRR